jgi:hypothetical protein
VTAGDEKRFALESGFCETPKSPDNPILTLSVHRLRCRAGRL